jgi:hypothetical protein
MALGCSSLAALALALAPAVNPAGGGGNKLGPAPVNVVLRGKSATVQLSAAAAKNLTGVRVLDRHDQPVAGVTATLGKADAAGRKVTVTAAKNATLGKHRLVAAGSTQALATVVVAGTAAEVDQAVKENNLREQKHRAALTGDGWKPAKSSAPDPRLLNLDPDAASKMKTALLHHLRTNAFAGPSLDRLYTLVTRVKDADIRAEAVRALGHARDPRAQKLLATLHGSVTEPALKTAIQQHLRPVQAAAVKFPAKVPFTQSSGFHFAKKETAINPRLATAIGRLKGKIKPGDWFAVKVTAQGDVMPATSQELANPGQYRQVFIVPTGYQDADTDRFISDFHVMIQKMGTQSDRVYTAEYRARIVYIAQWLPGGALGSAQPNFGASLFNHPVRGGKGLTLSQSKVFKAVDTFKQTKLPAFAPLAAMVLFNYDGGDTTASASPPTYLLPSQRFFEVKHYGIVRISRYDALYDAYRPMHELAHAALNFLDEYTEAVLRDANLTTLDALTPALLLDGTWGGWVSAVTDLFGIYDVRLSECLADNGNDNVSLRFVPATVGASKEVYPIEGGAFFGHGTFRASGNNIMAGFDGPKGSAFGFDHSAPQRQVIHQVFEAPHRAGRPNDRLRNAGPLRDWLPQFGNKVHLLLFDADHNHRWHPTTQYEVEVGFNETVWKVCYVKDAQGKDLLIAGQRVPYPCPDDVWHSSVKAVQPSPRTVDLRKCFAAQTAGLMQSVLTGLGVDSIEAGGGSINLSAMTVDQLLQQTLPTVTWPAPYQDVEVDAPNPLTTYYWRFRTYNGTLWSDWTSWGHFQRGA